jgi:DNA-binding NarL/FixJ family response regulator
MGAEDIRVALVEDDPNLREAMRLLIAGTPGFVCSGTFGSAEALLADCRGGRSDVLLLDINLPGRQGCDAVADIRLQNPALAVVMLTVYDDDDRVFRSLCNGACGYLLKGTPPTRLLEAIREAHEGGAPMSSSIARRVVDHLRSAPIAEPAGVALSPQQAKLLALLADGIGYQQAAEELGLSINTVRSYVRLIYEKLEVHSKAAAVTKALRSRLI